MHLVSYNNIYNYLSEHFGHDQDLDRDLDQNQDRGNLEEIQNLDLDMDNLSDFAEDGDWYLDSSSDYEMEDAEYIGDIDSCGKYIEFIAPGILYFAIGVVISIMATEDYLGGSAVFGILGIVACRLVKEEEDYLVGGIFFTLGVIINILVSVEDYSEGFSKHMANTLSEEACIYIELYVGTIFLVLWFLRGSERTQIGLYPDIRHRGTWETITCYCIISFWLTGVIWAFYWAHIMLRIFMGRIDQPKFRYIDISNAVVATLWLEIFVWAIKTKIETSNYWYIIEEIWRTVDNKYLILYRLVIHILYIYVRSKYNPSDGGKFHEHLNGMRDIDCAVTAILSTMLLSRMVIHKIIRIREKRNMENICAKIMAQIVYQKDSNNEDKCAICMDEFRDKEIISKLECTHCYHKQCIYLWFEKVMDCPCCKREFQVSHNRGDNTYLDRDL